MATKHLRQQIREALAAALTGLSTAGARVYVSRAPEMAFQASELPGLKIDTLEGGDITPLSLGGVQRYLERNLRVTLTAVVSAVSGYQDTTDAILKEVEEALSTSVAANTLGGLVKSITPDGEPEVQLNAEGDYTVAEARQLFIAVYITALNAPTVAQ